MVLPATYERTSQVMKTYYYQVAGFLLSVGLPAGKDAEALLPSFRPFSVAGPEAGEAPLFDFVTVGQEMMPAYGERELMEKTDNDMGRLSLYATADGYVVELANGGHTHLMAATRDFTSVRACLQWNDRLAGGALSSLLRIAFAQAILAHGAVSVHAAAVQCGGRAYLFMGQSGTGKSTHASLWVRHLPGTELLNDDNPTVRVVGDTVFAYGTPWSGKTACYKSLRFPVGGMVRLFQAPVNRFHRQEGADAFVAIYPGCSVIASDKRLRDGLYDTLARLAGMVTVGTMECRPDEEAARMCHRALAGN